ncbi:AMP-binding protein [Granulosicoccus sp. 3-233]|uniref:AMP-binding protein n=1 Tax=Granulosicoccus sp. 3-233 TaxID=3417969 RepID=UPI003D350DD2
MIDTSEPKSVFRLHHATSVRDASGRVLMMPSSVSSARQLPGIDQEQARVAGHDTDSGQRCVPELRFIRDDTTEHGLRQVFQAVQALSPFCVIPDGSDSVRLDENVDDEVTPALAGVTAASPVSTKNEELYLQCLSSGTSGEARRIQRSQQSWISSFEVNARMLQATADDSYAIVGRLSHSLPLYASLEACHIGADLHLIGDLRPDRQLSALKELQTSVLYLTPAQARLLCRARPAFGQQQVPGLRHVLCGGGKLDEMTRHALSELFNNAAIVEFYGASETSFITMSNQQTPEGSVGCAYPGVKLKILDEEGEMTTAEGEIWVSSPYLFSGYSQGGWRDTRWRDGYLSIGECGQLDEAGFLFLRGRKARQANVADTRVYLEEIEAVLLQHATVEHCVVVTRQDALRGEVLLAVVEGSFDEQWRRQLLSFARERLGATLAPREILFLDSLPYLDAGKPDIVRIQTLVTSL